MFSLILMMYFVGFSDSSEIPIIGIVKPFKPAMDQNIMHKEIGYPVKQYS